MKKKNLINYLIIFGFSLIYIIVLLNKYYYAHDLDFHTSNIISIANGISLTNPFPNKILPSLVNDLGYGVNIFYPVIQHLIGAYLYSIIGNINLTMKIYSILLINLSGIAMYKLINKLFKNEKQALVTAITYISMPYLYADFFIRCALNECFLFFLVPLILLGIHYLIDDNNKFKFHLLFTLGYVVAINSHLVLSIYLTLILLIYLFFQRKKVFKKEIIKEFIIASIFILTLTLNFTIPLIEHYNLGIYNIFNIDYTGINTVETVKIINYLLPVKHFDIPMYIPILFLMSFLYIFYKRNNIEKQDKNILKIFLIILIFSVLLAVSNFVWMIFPNLLKSIQFGWRMTLFIIIAVSIISGYIINFLNNDIKKGFIILLSIILISTNYITSLSTVIVDKEDIKFLNTETIKKWTKEYLPIESVDNIIKINQKEQNLGIVSNDIKLEIISNNNPDMKFNIKNIEEELTIEFPRIYYLGYRLTDNKNNTYKLTKNNKGLLSTKIKNDGTYKLEYKGTKLDNISYVLTFIFSIIFLIYIIYLKYNKKES